GVGVGVEVGGGLFGGGRVWARASGTTVAMTSATASSTRKSVALVHLTITPQPPHDPESFLLQLLLPEECPTPDTVSGAPPWRNFVMGCPLPAAQTPFRVIIQSVAAEPRGRRGNRGLT